MSDLTKKQLEKEFHRQCQLCKGLGLSLMHRMLDDALGKDPFAFQIQTKAQIKRERDEARDELANLKDDTNFIDPEVVENLEAQNRRLRDALQKIAENLIPTPISIARCALKD